MQVDAAGHAYVAAVGHVPDDHGRTPPWQAAALLSCGREMCEMARTMTFCEALGQLEVGAV